MLPNYKELTQGFRLLNYVVRNVRKLNGVDFSKAQQDSYLEFIFWVSQHEIDESDFYSILNGNSLSVKSYNVSYDEKESGLTFTVDFLMLENGKIIANDNNGFYWLFDSSEEIPFEKEVKFD